MKKYQKIVIDAGTSKASIWDAGETPMSLSEWNEFLIAEKVSYETLQPMREKKRNDISAV